MPVMALCRLRLKPRPNAIGASLHAVAPGRPRRNYGGIAVPLLDRHGDLVGGLNVSMPMGHESCEDAVKRVLPVLQETARAMRNEI